MKAIPLLTIAGLLFTLSNTWAINKCVGSDGKVVYQQDDCATPEAKRSVNTSGAGSADPASSGANYWARESEKQKRSQRVEEAIVAGEVFPGMTKDEAIRSWGRPTKINNSTGTWGRSEQWVYDRGRIGNSQYLYFDNGVLRSTQSPDSN